MTVKLIPTTREIKRFAINAARSEAQLREVPVTRFKPGDMPSLLLTGAAAGHRKAVEWGNERFDDQWVSFAKDARLDVAMENKYFSLEKRFPATYSTVTLYMERPDASAGAGKLEAGHRAQASVDTTSSEQAPIFELVEDCNWSASQLKAKAIFKCTQSGTVGRVDKNKVTTWVDTPFDTTITVNNPAPSSGGNPKETDDQYRQRGLESETKGMVGSSPAIKSGALELENIWFAEVDDDSQGNCWLAVADASGFCSEDMLNIARDDMMNYVAAGGNPITLPIVRHYVPVTAVLYISKKVRNPDSITRAARTNLLELNMDYKHPDRPLRPGVDLDFGMLEEALSRPTGVIKYRIHSPVNTIQAKVNQWITIAENYIDITTEYI